MSFICQSNHQIIGSLSIAIAIAMAIPCPTIALPSISVIAVVGVSFWLWLGGSLAVAVFVSGDPGRGVASSTIITAKAIGGWCRVGRCPLFEGDAKQKQAHLEEKINIDKRVILFTRRRKWSLMLLSLVLKKSATL